MSGHNLLAYARRSAGLTQNALARLAGTSQPTLPAYERGTKSPTLAVAERIIEATGHRLEVAPNLEFVQLPGQYGLHPFWLADRLWRLDPSLAFRQVVLPGVDHDWPAPRTIYELSNRADRAPAYELVLREGSPSDMLDYIDGALLVDLWNDLDLPMPIRHAWQPLVRKTVGTRRRGDGPGLRAAARPVARPTVQPSGRADSHVAQSSDEPRCVLGRPLQ